MPLIELTYGPRRRARVECGDSANQAPNVSAFDDRESETLARLERPEDGCLQLAALNGSFRHSGSLVCEDHQVAGSCILCGGKPLTRSHYVPSHVRNVLREQPASFTIMGNASLTHPEAVLETTERSFGRGVFDTQPKVLCMPCNSAWMTRAEDVAGPLLAAMITSPEPVLINDLQVEAVATWAFASMIIRSTVDPGIPRLASSLMHQFREEGLNAVDLEMAVFALANCRALFDGPAIGATYIADSDAPGASATMLLFLETIVVVIGVGSFAEKVRLMRRVHERAVALAWPSTSASARWPTRSVLPDSLLLPSLGFRDYSRSMFVPATPPRGRTKRSIVRVPEPLMRTGISSDPMVIQGARVFEEMVAQRLAAASTDPQAPGRSAP